MTYDDVITHVGAFGRYQRRIYFFLCLPTISCAFHKLAWVFVGAKVNHRCRLPLEDMNATYTLDPEVWNMSIPWDFQLKKHSSCRRYEANFKFDSSQPATSTDSCSDWIFDHSVYESSAVMDWNLVCDRAWLRATADALFMIGVLLGSIVFGDLSDRLGRRPVFFASLVLQEVGGLLAAVAPEYITFVVARMVVGSTTTGLYLIGYVSALEMVGSTKRHIVGTISPMFFSLGYMLTALVAYLIRDWRHLQLALTLPGLAFMCYWWFMPESARWLLTKGRKQEAIDILLCIGYENKVDVSREKIEELLALGSRDQMQVQEGREETNPELSRPLMDIESKQNNDDNNAKIEKEQSNELVISGASKERIKPSSPSLFDLFRYPNLRKKTFYIFFIWFVISVTYWGLSWSTSNLGGNDYLNFLISGMVEIPGYSVLLLLLNRWGRKATICSALVIAGVSLLLTQVVPTNLGFIVVALAMIGKMTITTSYGGAYIFTAEQFPTVIRSVGLGAASTSGKVAAILAPYLNLLADFWRPLPLVIFGTLSLLAACLALLLPETLNKTIPETIQDGEQFCMLTKTRSPTSKAASPQDLEAQV